LTERKLQGALRLKLSETRESIEDPPPDEVIPTRRSFRKRLRAYLLLTVCVSVMLGIVFYRPLFQENLAVIDSQVVRSAQPGGRLTDWIRDYRLASILNLRGGTPADSWYAEEVKTAAANHVAFFDYPMMATRRPSRRDLLTIVDFFRSSPFPVLIHCKQGADRTGLAVALYRMVCLNEPPERAMEAFSIFHGHIPIVGTQRLHEPFLEYAQWLKDQAKPHTADRFRGWIKDHYRSNEPSVDPRPLVAGPRPLGR
jgi:hypothetical protein